MVDDKTIIILHGKNKFFGQTRKPWVSMDLERMINSLEEQGYNVENYEYQEIINKNIEIKDSIVFYSFSQRENVRAYIKDIIHHLSNYNNLIVPSYDFLLCHENKGYQELLKKRLGITSLDCIYFSDKDEIDKTKINFPVVLKKIDGSNGKNVYLVNDQEELNKKLKYFEHTANLKKFDLFRRKYLRKKKSYKEYPNYSNKRDYEEYKDYIIQRDNFVLQEFIPNLEYDFRVLVIHDKYFVTRRFVKEGDFRASGAKKFDFSFEVDLSLLNYSKEIYNKFDTPFLSMDICKSGDKYYLIEYQAIHFGLNVVVKSNGYYLNKAEQWKFIENNNIIEDEMVYGLSKYLERKLAE